MKASGLMFDSVSGLVCGSLVSGGGQVLQPDDRTPGSRLLLGRRFPPLLLRGIPAKLSHLISPYFSVCDGSVSFQRHSFTL